MLYYVTSPVWNLTMFSVKRVQKAMHRWFAWGATIVFFKFCLAVRTWPRRNFLEILFETWDIGRVFRANFARNILDFIFKARRRRGDLSRCLEVLVVDARGRGRSRRGSPSPSPSPRVQRAPPAARAPPPGLRVGWLRRHIVKEILW